MNDIIDYAINRKSAFILLLIMIIISGVVTYRNIPVEKTPDVQFPAIYVSVKHEGISPEDAESMIIKPLEVELRGIEGVKEIRAVAREGFASIFIEFSAGFDSKIALQDVREAVETAKSELPEDSEEPSVSEINLSTFPVLNVIMYGDLPEAAMQKIADDLKDKIETVPSVLEVDIAGERESEVDVIINPMMLESYNLSTSIIEIARQNNQLIAAGALDNEDGRFVVKVPGLLDDVEDILELPLVAEGDNVVKVKDVADVRKTFKDATGYARVNGKPALVLEVSKRIGANIIETIDSVKQIVDEEKQLWPTGLDILYSQDQSDDIKDMLSELQNNIILAVLLVITVIIAFIGTKAAMLVAISIPGSFLIGILTIGMLDMTLNVVVLFSLILSVGLLVDSAIVVIEYANRKMAEGQTPRRSFRLAAKRVAWPIIASTITTLVVFAPLLFWPGIIGQFMKYMPLTLIATLGGSLFMALIFMPVVGTVIGRPDKYDKEATENIRILEQGNLDDLKGFTKRYVNTLDYVIRNSGKFALTIIALLIFVVILYSSFGKGVEFFPKIEPTASQVVIKARGNLSTLEKDQILKEVENKIFNLDDEIRIFYTRSGNVAGQGKDFSEDAIGVVTIEYEDWQQRRSAEKITQEIRETLSAFSGIELEVLDQKEGPPNAKEITIEVSSRFSDLIEPLTDREVDILKLIGQGLGNSEIAEKLYISKNTVKTHVSHIFQKLSVNSRTEAAFYAMQKGLIES